MGEGGGMCWERSGVYGAWRELEADGDVIGQDWHGMGLW